MSEARTSRVSSRRFLSCLRTAAVAFFATAFLFSGAQAAKRPTAPAKKAVTAESKKSTASKKDKAASKKAATATGSKSARKTVAASAHTGKKASVVADSKSKKGPRTVVAKGKGSSRVTAVADKRGIKVAKARGRRGVVRVVEVTPPRPSYGELAGLHNTNDALELKSSVALVVDQDTREVLFSKNDHAVLPIASITKLMTGLLISEARLPMDEEITITQDDVDTEKGSRSRLSVGTTLTRGELMHLALMSSENRAAHALGRTYPGGLPGFVKLMNAKAQILGMKDTRYVEPTGLSSNNQSSAQDLAVLVNVAYGDATMRQLTTSPEYQVEVGRKTVQFNTTNRLVKDPDWNIGLQKTGYISEAGQCLVMQARIAGRKLIMVFLDSSGKFSRIADAERVRRWVEANQVTASARRSAISG